MHPASLPVPKPGFMHLLVSDSVPVSSPGYPLAPIVTPGYPGISNASLVSVHPGTSGVSGYCPPAYPTTSSYSLPPRDPVGGAGIPDAFPYVSAYLRIRALPVHQATFRLGIRVLLLGQFISQSPSGFPTVDPFNVQVAPVHPSVPQVPLTHVHPAPSSLPSEVQAPHANAPYPVAASGYPPSSHVSGVAPVNPQSHPLDQTFDTDTEFPVPGKSADYRQMMEFIIRLFPQAEGERPPVRLSRSTFEKVFPNEPEPAQPLDQC